MVFAVTDVWKIFIEERDQCGNIATSMREAKQRFSAKTKVTKRKNVKTTVTKTKRTKARKSLIAIIKTAIVYWLIKKV